MFINKFKKENIDVGTSRSSMANKKCICNKIESVGKKNVSDKIRSYSQRKTEN
jgi:hypothetical protein